MSEGVEFGLMMVMVLTWLFLVHRTLIRLAYWHPETYEELGEPRVFRSTATSFKELIRSNLATFMFIVTRRHASMDDSALSRLSDAALLILIVYLVLCLYFLPPAAG